MDTHLIFLNNLTKRLKKIADENIFCAFIALSEKLKKCPHSPSFPKKVHLKLGHAHVDEEKHGPVIQAHQDNEKQQAE